MGVASECGLDGVSYFHYTLTRTLPLLSCVSVLLPRVDSWSSLETALETARQTSPSQTGCTWWR